MSVLPTELQLVECVAANSHSTAALVGRVQQNCLCNWLVTFGTLHRFIIIDNIPKITSLSY